MAPEGSIAGYDLVDVLGEGGAGVVYRARRPDGSGDVAVKVLKASGASSAGLRRFVREARAAAAVVHPSVVPVIEAGQDGDRHYLVMPHLGPTLGQRIADAGPLPLAEALRAVRHVASGLSAIHAAGFVHRDVKPSNVLATPEGRWAVADLGLARGEGWSVLTRAGQVLGTLDYSAPEALRGSQATPATDVYALGCVAFECLAGRPPFGGRPMIAVGMAHLEEEPPDPCAGRDDVPHEVGRIVCGAMAKEPGDRPPTAAAFAHLLVAAAGPVG